MAAMVSGPTRMRQRLLHAIEDASYRKASVLINVMQAQLVDLSGFIMPLIGYCALKQTTKAEDRKWLARARRRNSNGASIEQDTVLITTCSLQVQIQMSAIGNKVHCCTPAAPSRRMSYAQCVLRC